MGRRRPTAASAVLGPRAGYAKPQVAGFLDAAGIVRTAYRVLAFTIAALVAIQAAAIGYAVLTSRNRANMGTGPEGSGIKN
jgi:hypothetical protein